MAQEDKKIFHSFQELRQHFFPKQHLREQARKEMEQVMKKDEQNQKEVNS
jgi:hypothetical protein